MELIHYGQVDGAWTLSDTHLKKMWEIMVLEGNDKRLFYGNSVRTAEEFIRWFKMPMNIVNFQFEGNEPVSVAWMNDIQKNNALIHFCIFKKFWGKDTVKIGRNVLDYWFSLEKDGKPVLDVLRGITPESHRMALSYIKKLGFNCIGTIPKMINGTIGAVFSYQTREQYHGCGISSSRSRNSRSIIRSV